MNPLINEAAAAVNLGWLLGVLTVVFIAGFGFWIWWAWAPGNRRMLEEVSRMPLNDGDES
jgi:cbb3-type cytochrome oxidase subunit 3